MDAERARERVAHALRLALEREVELGRMRAFDQRQGPVARWIAR